MSDPANMVVLAGERGAVRLEHRPMPKAPDADGLIVRMLFAPINPADLLMIDGRYSIAIEAGAPLGAEGVAIVEQAGSGVTDLRRGDLVLPLDRGNWAQYRRISRARVMSAPPGLDPRQAAMMRINPATAWLLLEASGVTAGECLIQNAATSAVAHWVRLLATARDVAVIDVVRPGAVPFSANALADDDDLATAVRAASGGRPIRAALDCVAGASTGRLAACLDPDGLVLVFGHLSGEPSTVPSQLLTRSEVTVRGFTLRRAEARMAPRAYDDMFSALGAIALEHRTDPPVRAVIPLVDADRAVALARAPGRGRVLLDLGAISGM